jgi:hypothetical protein
MFSGRLDTHATYSAPSMTAWALASAAIASALSATRAVISGVCMM